jgi:SAM-dependent methyltransferase
VSEYTATAATVSRACPLCGHGDRSRVFVEAAYDPGRMGQFAFASRKLPEYMHYRLLVCAECDLLYASPAPAPETLDEAYRTAAYDSAAESACAARTYAGLVRRILGRLPGRNGALDIGAGDGAFLKELLALGFTDVAGVEPSAAPIAAADSTIRPLIGHCPFRAHDFPAGQFSLITCFQTLEHVYDPLQLCRDACGLLKDGGAMLIVVHNRQALSARLLGRRSPIFDIEHLQLFSRRSAQALLRKAGFGQIGSSVVLNRYRASYWLRLLPLPGRLKQRAIAAANALAVGRLPITLPAGNLAIWGYKTGAEQENCEVVEPHHVGWTSSPSSAHETDWKSILRVRAGAEAGS